MEEEMQIVIFIDIQATIKDTKVSEKSMCRVN